MTGVKRMLSDTYGCQSTEVSTFEFNSNDLSVAQIGTFPRGSVLAQAEGAGRNVHEQSREARALKESKSLEITDLRAASGKQYEVDYEGFLLGALQYIDRDYTFDYVPECVRGQTHIKTAGDDKKIDENELCFSFVANTPVTVYVLYADKLRALPSWLRDFTDTREKVTRGDSSTTTLKGIFTLFSKDFPEGTVALNGNQSREMLSDPHYRASSSGYCMYSVVVRPR